ncbi:hypothetical protein DFH06DRAFT_729396 [Mycena polygramma]|nr:hypothetical protein DFH06DRAFT_729396 [Mycena polygramma]
MATCLSTDYHPPFLSMCPPSACDPDLLLGFIRAPGSIISAECRHRYSSPLRHILPVQELYFIRDSMFTREFLSKPTSVMVVICVWEQSMQVFHPVVACCPTAFCVSSPTHCPAIMDGDWFEVIEQADGTLTCNCPSARATGKTCGHTFGVNLERDFGSVDAFNELETIRQVRGKASRGQQNNPTKEKPGRQQQRRKDRSVVMDRDRFFDQVDNNVNPWVSDSESHKSDSDSSAGTEGNEDGVVEDPLNRIGTVNRVGSGRPAATEPLHPGRTSGKNKGKQRQRSPSPDAASGPVKFSNPPGPKRGHPNSLLPGTSPAKKEADEKEKKRKADELKQQREEEKERKRQEKAKKIEAKEQKRVRKRMAEREPEDQANETHMFVGVDELVRWFTDWYFMRDDEEAGFSDIATSLSACLGSGILVLPRYYSRLADDLRSMSKEDWDLPTSAIIDRANAEALADRSKANMGHCFSISATTLD